MKPRFTATQVANSPRPERPMARVFHALLLALFALPASAQRVVDDPTLGVRVIVPKGWSHQIQGRTLTMAPLGGTSQIGLTVKVDPTSASSPAALAKAAQARIAGKPGYEAVTAIELPTRGGKAPGLSVVVPGKQGKLKVEQVYLIKDGKALTIAVVAPVAIYAKHAAGLRKILAEVGPSAGAQPPADAPESTRLAALARRCGSEVSWASSWAEAAARAHRERKLLLVRIRRYGSFGLIDHVQLGPLMDRRVLDMIRHRFVALDLSADQPSPLKHAAVYGLGGTTFGEGVLLLTPDAKLIHQFAPRGVELFERELRHGLALARERALPAEGALGGGPAGGLPRARWLAERGELDAAEALLTEPAGAGGWLLRARIAGRRHQLEPALAHLKRARQSGGAEALAAELTLLEVRLLMGGGRVDQAQAAIAAGLKASPADEIAAELHVLRGMCLMAKPDAAAAAVSWRRALALAGQGRQAWLAAALLVATAKPTGNAWRVAWPSSAAMQAFTRVRGGPVGRARAGEACAQAARYLLGAQQANGRWIPVTELMSDRPDDPHAEITQAGALIGLLAHRQREGAAEAIRRGAARLIALITRRTAAETKPSYMDHQVWASCYGLLALLRCRKAGLLPDDAPADLLAGRVRELLARQKPSGGWGYLLTTDLNAPGALDGNAMSFCTATVLMALGEAAAAGVPVPRERLLRGARCLASMRAADGTFHYGIGKGFSGRSGGAIGAVGRGPLCELALLPYGDGDVARLRRALHRWVEASEVQVAEQGKPLMHAGPGGLGSHYILYNAAGAARAVAALPEAERAALRASILGVVLRCRNADGSFTDNPMLGRHLTTSLALDAFAQLGLPAR